MPADRKKPQSLLQSLKAHRSKYARPAVPAVPRKDQSAAGSGPPLKTSLVGGAASESAGTPPFKSNSQPGVGFSKKPSAEETEKAVPVQSAEETEKAVPVQDRLAKASTSSFYGSWRLDLVNKRILQFLAAVRTRHKNGANTVCPTNCPPFKNLPSSGVTSSAGQRTRMVQLTPWQQARRNGGSLADLSGHQAVASPLGYGPSPWPQLEAFITSTACKGGAKGHVRSWAVMGDIRDVLLFNIDGNRWCGNIGRPHKSNGIFLVADMQAGVWYQRCYDPECKQYTSEAMPLPSHAKLEWTLHQAEGQHSATEQPLAQSSVIKEVWPDDAQEDDLDEMLSAAWIECMAT